MAGHDRRPAASRSAPRYLQLDDVAVAAASAALASFGLTHAVGVPRDLRQRLRQFLQPAVVGEAAVRDRRVWPEDDLQTRHRSVGGCGSRAIGRSRRSCLESPPPQQRPRLAASPRRACRPRNPPVVQHVPPEAVGALERLAVAIGDRPSRRPCPTGRASSSPSRGRAPDLPRCASMNAASTSCAGRAVVERRDERLHQRDGAVERARVAPALERSAPRGRSSGSSSAVSSS